MTLTALPMKYWRGIKMKRDKCPLCYSVKKTAVYWHKLVPISEIPTLYDSIAVCGDCGMVYAEAVLEQDVYDSYYRQFSKYETNYQEHESSAINAYHSEIADIVCEAVPSKESAIADFGAGYGSILSKLKNRGYNNLCAIEISESNCRHIADNLGIAVINKSFFELPHPEANAILKKCDCVILKGVLEHLSDFHRAVTIIDTYLSDNGIAIVLVPAFGENIQHTAMTAPFEEFSPEHINYFTTHSLTLLMNLHGFTLLESQIIQCTSPELVGVYTKLVSDDVRQYAECCAAELQPSIALIAQYAVSGQPLAIRGTGLLTRSLFANSDLSKCNIVAVTDTNRNYQGRTIAGHTISAPDIAVLPPEADILIISYFYADAIKNELLAGGSKNKIVCLPC
jgi:SAM-dependent methyltransferase